MLDEKFIKFQFVSRMIIAGIIFIYMCYLEIGIWKVGPGFDALGYGFVLIFVVPIFFANLLLPFIAKKIIKPTMPRIIIYRILMTMTFLVELLYIAVEFDTQIRYYRYYKNIDYLELGFCIVWLIYVMTCIYFTYRKKLHNM